MYNLYEYNEISSIYAGLSRLPSGLMARTVTLEDSFKLYGDENKTISYLKVDVEGSELEAFPTWTDPSSTVSTVRSYREFTQSSNC